MLSYSKPTNAVPVAHTYRAGAGISYCQAYYTAVYPQLKSFIGQRIVHSRLPFGPLPYKWQVACISIDSDMGIAYCTEVECPNTSKRIRIVPAIEIERGDHLKRSQPSNLIGKQV